LILLAKIEILEIFVSTFDGGVIIQERIKKETCIGSTEEMPFVLNDEQRRKGFACKGKKTRVKIAGDFISGMMDILREQAVESKRYGRFTI